MTIEKTLADHYSQNHSSEIEPLLYKIESDSFLKAANGKMISTFVQGRLLSFISNLLKPKRILEVGSFTGYSAICLAEGLTDGGRLLTIESNKSLKSILEANIKASSQSEKIEVQFGKALDILQQLDLVSFNLVFIDAAKKEYQKYYDLLVNHLHSDSILLIDNVLWRGEVWKKDKKNIGKAMDAFNKYVRDDVRVSNFILPINDGLNIIKIK